MMESAEGDGTNSPPTKRRGRPPGAKSNKDYSQTIEQGADRSTRSRSRSRKGSANSNVTGRALSDITPHVDDGQSKRKRVVTEKRPTSSYHPQPNENNSNRNELTSDTPLVPRKLDQIVPCEGIAQGLDSKSLAIFLGSALKTKGDEFIESARGGSKVEAVDSMLGTFLESGTTANMLAPSLQDLVCRKLNGGMIITTIECTGSATDKFGNDFTERPTQGYSRCLPCRQKAENRRKLIKRLCEGWDNDVAEKIEKVDCIAKDPRKAKTEIETLRKAVSKMEVSTSRLSKVEMELKELKDENERLRGKIEKAEMILRNEKRLDNLIVLEGTAADNMVKVANLIDEAIEEDLRKANDEDSNNKRVMWKVFLRRLLQLYAVGGNARKVEVFPAILNWSIVYCARTSKRLYLEVAKVMRLSSYSWVCNVSSLRVSKANSRAFSICTVTLSELNKQAIAQKWSPTARCGFLAADAASCTEGISWNYTSKQLEGQSDSFKFQTLHNKFHKVADKLNPENSNPKEGASILDDTPLAKEHCVCKWTSVCPENKASEIVASTNCETFNADVVFKMTHSLHSTMPIYALWALGIAGDGAGPNWRSFLLAATHTVADFLSKELMNKWPEIDFGIKMLMKHPVTGNPFLYINDHMHLAKTNVNTLENSSSKTSKRCLMYKKCYVNLRMIEIAWKATGGGTNQLQPTNHSKGQHGLSMMIMDE